MIDGKLLTEKLIRYAGKFLHMQKRDEIYFRNLLLREFKVDEPYEGDADLTFIDSLDVPDVLVAEIEKYATQKNLCEDGMQNLYSTYIMGLISPLPSKVNETFNTIKKEQGIEEACKYFYDLSIKNNYVQKTAIGRNLKWECQDGERFLEITVNLSKPEKDNKEIAKLLKAPKKAKYPACFLCKENEGFQGTLTHPARENIRTISLTMGGEPWFVQYSPYAYYNEHMIAISEAHVPMHIAGDTIDKLLDFVDFFPNYMIGSNAALPIIGGSILNHEHFQGGEHLMPMHKAPLSGMYLGYFSRKYKKVKIGVVDWYNSVIRLQSKNRKQIAALAKLIIETWSNHTDEVCGIFAETDGVKHNSLAPVCRKIGNEYVFDMILRNNITSKEYPDGVFHAHPEYHNIKKEGIGLIEAMGLFILPGRLKTQLNMIAEILCGVTAYDEKELSDPKNYLYAHRDMIKELMQVELPKKDMESAMQVVTEKVNDICKNILFNTSVYKKDEQGYKGFTRFLKACALEQKKQ
ncbi:MAG: UDP-glucose--hexose-1-phosphate uridylyltransferase [Clostridia bacterium]|nr:UDP-glucose--hexose-1-phosphate uridylyltransferase [Clostridia bacterium]